VSGACRQQAPRRRPGNTAAPAPISGPGGACSRPGGGACSHQRRRGL